MTIWRGASVDFSSMASGSGTLPLSYSWSFGTAAPASARTSPGLIAFAQTGVYTVTMTVTDSAVIPVVSSETRTITVVGDNPPQAPDIHVMTNGVNGMTGNLPASDPDGDTLNYSILQNGLKGQIVLVNAASGLYNYTPAPGFSGDDIIQFRVSDGLGGFIDAQLVITLDSDGDGISDAEEITLGTNPHATDSDGDGLNDYVEINIHHTDPLNADSDGDGLNDGVEVNTYGTSPLNPDTDSDGLSDRQEITLGTDPLNADTDGDGVNDNADVFPFDPAASTDVDGDGKPDAWNASATAAQIAASTLYLDPFVGVQPMLAQGSAPAHSVALKNDGHVWAWGYNYYGQLGDGTNGATAQRLNPVEVLNASSSAPLMGVQAVAVGGNHTLALKVDGTVWAWGKDSLGALGDGSGVSASNMVQVTGLTGIIAIAAGKDHSVALKSDGTVWAWGYNPKGQLGDGTIFFMRPSPVQSGTLTNIIAISAGDSYTMALASDGTVWTWGDNAYGQLGNGTTTNSSVPVQVSGLAGVTAIAAGGFHALALKSDGTMMAWGANGNGQLGIGSTVNRSIPVQVVDAGVAVIGGITEISAGRVHSLAVKSDNTLLVWGDNSSRQMGDGTQTDRLNPQQVLASGTALPNIADITGAYTHTLTMQSSGLVWGWGSGANGRLGEGTSFGVISHPVQTIDVTTGLGFSLIVPDSDSDGAPDTVDAFPTDPAASVDSDHDGHPDAWNAGKTAADSTGTPPLTLDVFPNDATRWQTVTDTTAPVIKLLGQSPLTIAQGSSYADAGATASDNIDGDITSNIIVGSNVNTSMLGSYMVNYNVSDAAGNVAVTVIRTVNVVVNISHIYNLVGDWNLISFPMDLGATGLTDFLTAVPEATSVWSFVNGGWQSLIVGKPVFLNSLNLLEVGKGYWVQLPAGVVKAVTLSGPPLSVPPNLVSGSGWNLIGVTTPVTDMAGFIASTGAKSVWAFSNGQWQSFLAGTPIFLNSLQGMNVGIGYYVNMK